MELRIGPTRIALADASAATVWRGGSAGAPMVLLHGGWAGAQAHWSPVWDELAARYRVVAPDLPGIAADAGPALTRYDAYVDWLARLLDELDSAGAIVVGNSFGATLAWLLALNHPRHCRAVVMVDGLAPPQLPAPLRGLMRISLLRRLALRHMRRSVYGPAALITGFHEAERAPDEVRACLQREDDDPRVGAMLEIVLASRTPPAQPQQPALIVWGESDRLPGSGVEVARRLQASWPGSHLVVIPEAGHLPQVEQPGAFVEALIEFVDRLER